MKNISETDIKLEGIELEAYRQCFLSKHHYDMLSWTICGFVGLIQVALITGMLKLDPSKGIEFQYLKIALGIIGLLTILIWFSVYERNRFWSEVANETARNIERKAGISGPAIEFMKSALEKKVILKNLDEQAKPYKDYNEMAVKPLFNISMHFGIRSIMLLFTILNIYLMFSQVKV